MGRRDLLSYSNQLFRQFISSDVLASLRQEVTKPVIITEIICLTLYRNGHKSTLMGPKTIGVKYLRDPIDDSLNISGFVSHPDQQDALIVAISDNMTDDEKISTMVENLRRTTAQGVVRAFMDKTDRRNAAEELLSRQSHHGPINHQGSNGQPELESPTQTNSVSPLQTYRYPQFDPGCSAEDYGMIRDFLFANRQQLALESGCFDIPEHLMLAYINRLGHDLQPNIWRGFLLSCGKKGELFRYASISISVVPRFNKTIATGRSVLLQHQLLWQ